MPKHVLHVAELSSDLSGSNRPGSYWLLKLQQATVEPTESATSADAQSLDKIKSGAPQFSDDFHRDNKVWNLDSGKEGVTFAYSQRAFHIKVDVPQEFTWSTGDITITDDGFSAIVTAAAGRIEVSGLAGQITTGEDFIFA